MALTLSELQAQRDLIVKEMSLPQAQHFAEDGLTRRSIGDLQKALATIDQEIANTTAATTGVTRGRITRIRTHSGK